MNKWYSSVGNNGDVVLASKIKLVRNLKGMPFPCRMTNELRKSVSKKLYAAIQNSPLAGEFDLTELDRLSAVERTALAEKGLISAQMAKQEGYSAVLVSKDKSISIMLCEENHITICAMCEGLDLETAYKKADEIDNIFIANTKIAFDEKLGFLTSNPLQLGTGMRASVMLHLPAIADRTMMTALSNMVSKLGFSVKSLFSDGGFFELSNEISLGITEQSAIQNLEGICEQIVKQERAFRDEFINYDDFQDKIFRALGTLKMARQLSSAEFYSMISLARLGVAMHIFDSGEHITYECIGDMMYSLGTAVIMSGGDKDFTPDEANRLRAQYVRERLNK